MDLRLAHLLEYGEGNMAAATFGTPVPGGAGIQVAQFEIGGAICVVAPDLPAHSRYNVVFGLGVSQPATEVMIDEIITRYRQMGVPGFTIGLSPLAQPTELATWLEARGLNRVVNIAKVYRNPHPVPVVESELIVRRIGPEYAAAFADITCAVSTLPPAAHSWIQAQVGRTGYHFLAFDGVEPVAAAALYVHDGVASLHMAATVPSHRGRGAQKALQAARLALAAELGCKWAVTETPEETPESPNPSYRSMMRMGFRLGYLRPHYLWENRG